MCFICILSALSQKFSSLLFQKKNIPKISAFLPPQRRQLLPLKKGTKREKKKRRRFVPLLCPAARARCSFLTAREGQKHFRAYQTGARKRRERESAFFVVQIRRFSFSLSFAPLSRARENSQTTNDYKEHFFFSYAANKKCFWEKNSRFFRVNSIARNLPKLPPTRTTKTRCDWEFERASEFSASFEGEFWTSDALFYSLFFIYVCTIF